MEHKFKTTNIKGKEYVQVNERIKYFRETYPEGKIITTMLKNENGVCIFKADIYKQQDLIDVNSNATIPAQIVSTGHAQEKEDDKNSFVNKTSYIENCETSAIGRALGILGIGIDSSIATAEEVETAIAQQDKPSSADPVPVEETDTKKEVLSIIKKRFATKEDYNAWCAKKAIKKPIKDMNESELNIMLDILNEVK